MSENNVSMEFGGQGIGVLGLLGLIFVTLKLCGVITWSWWWVTIPFWGMAALGVGFMAIGLILMVIGMMFGAEE